MKATYSLARAGSGNLPITTASAESFARHFEVWYNKMRTHDIHVDLTSCKYSLKGIQILAKTFQGLVFARMTIPMQWMIVAGIPRCAASVFVTITGGTTLLIKPSTPGLFERDDVVVTSNGDDDNDKYNDTTTKTKVKVEGSTPGRAANATSLQDLCSPISIKSPMSLCLEHEDEMHDNKLEGKSNAGGKQW